MGTLALIVPFATIAPEYAPPAPLSALPGDAQPVYARFGDVALVGYQMQERYQPGDAISVTVYWQVIAASQHDDSLFLHAVLDDGTTIGKIDNIGAGRLRDDPGLPARFTPTPMPSRSRTPASHRWLGFRWAGGIS
ncbi:MAG: hypothetical protein U0521_25335 [Anaerolineae bacterium]